MFSIYLLSLVSVCFSGGYSVGSCQFLPKAHGVPPIPFYVQIGALDPTDIVSGDMTEQSSFA